MIDDDDHDDHDDNDGDDGKIVVASLYQHS